MENELEFAGKFIEEFVEEFRRKYCRSCSEHCSLPNKFAKCIVAKFSEIRSIEEKIGMLEADTGILRNVFNKIQKCFEEIRLL